MTTEPRRRIPSVVMLLIGLGLGWGMAIHRPPVAKAVGSDRYGDYSLTSGPISIQYNDQTKVQAPVDAIYFLDYKGARLVATVPIQRSTMSGSQLIDQFIERDLIADFKIDTDHGANPHFLMTNGSMGAFGEGGAPLFVFETTTKQVAVYRLQSLTVGTKASSKLDLVELKTYASIPPLPTGPRAN
jgi:hypothetical protein